MGKSVGFVPAGKLNRYDARPLNARLYKRKLIQEVQTNSTVMPSVSIRQTVAPISFRCKLRQLVPHLRQLAAQRNGIINAEVKAAMSSIRIAS